MRITISLVALALLGSAAAYAQDEAPAVDTSKPAPAAAAAKGGEKGLGLVIEQDQETPFGLVIAPWINSQSERDIDRPARLLQEQPLLVDRLVLARQIEYFDALEEAAKAKIVAPKP